MTDIPPPSTYHKLTSSTKHTTQPDKPSQQPSEQKPKLTHLIKQQLARSAPIRENIYTIPNLLTFSRLLATPAICYFIVNDQFAYAVALFGYAGVTDLLDGWIARRWNLQSVVGSVVDPMADKALMVALTTTLAWKGLLPVWLAAIILGRDVSLAIAAIYYRFASLPPPKTLARYWDFSLPSAEVHPTTVSKLNTLLQLLLIGAATALPLVTSTTAGAEWATSSLPSSILDVLGDGESVRVTDLVSASQWLVAGTTVWSGVSYLWTRDVVKILRKEMSEGEKRRISMKGRVVLGVSFGVVLLGAVMLDRPWDDD